MCTKPVKTVEELKGKRIRATGAAVELVKLAGGMPVSVTLPETVGILQRGGIDCTYGLPEWLKTYGFGDFAKHVVDYPLGVLSPVVAFLMRRDTFHKLTPEQKVIHLRAAARIAAVHSIGNFIVKNEESYKHALDKMGVQKVRRRQGLRRADGQVQGRRARRATSRSPRASASPIRTRFSTPTPATIEKWQKLSKDIGRDPAKLEEALWREVYSKLDPEKL